MALELTLIRRLALRDHLAQVLGTYAVILIANDLVKMIWGPAPVMLNMPAALSDRCDCCRTCSIPLTAS